MNGLNAAINKWVYARFVSLKMCLVLCALLLSLLSYQQPTQAATLLFLNEGTGGKYSSLALNSSSIPVMSYQDTVGGNNLAVLLCNSATYCDEPTIRILDESSSFRYTSLALDSSDRPVISYYDDQDGELELARCDTPTCDTVTITTVESAGNPGLYDSLTLDSNDLPIISHIDGPNANLEIVFCADLVCSSHTSQVLDDNGFGWTSIELDNTGRPVVSYTDGNNDLKVARCDNVGCTSVTVITLDNTINAAITSLELDSGDSPVVSYFDADNADLKLARCTDATCSTVNRTTVDSAGRVGESSSLGLTASGNPIISYFDSTNGDANLAVCNDALCSSPDITFFDFFPLEVGSDTSLVVDNDTPIFTFQADADLALYNGKNNLPELVTNTAVTVTSGVPYTIRSTVLNTIDVDNVGSPSPLTYTVTVPPEQGGLNFNTFTQAQINSNNVIYTYNGVRSDSYTFTISDGEDTVGPFIFNINLSAPSAAPSQNYLVTSQPTLSWDGVSYATEYEIQVDRSSTFTLPLDYATTVSASTLSHLIHTPLTLGRYYWHVRGRIDADDWGPWSAPQSFAVDP